MKTFKSFITENKITLAHSPKALETHMQYHELGIPLPDRDDLYQTHVGGPVRYPKNDGGYVEHRPADQSITHYNAAGEPHRLDGPASVSLHGVLQPKIWAVDGNSVGELRQFNYTDGTKLHSFFTHHHFHNGISPSWSSREVNTLREFNKHLTDHGIVDHRLDD